MAKNAETKKNGRLMPYLRNVRIEVKKVVWPTKKELVSYTGVVVFACVFFALGIWAVDSVFSLGLKHLLGISL